MQLACLQGPSAVTGVTLCGPVWQLWWASRHPPPFCSTSHCLLGLHLAVLSAGAQYGTALHGVCSMLSLLTLLPCCPTPQPSTLTPVTAAGTQPEVLREGGC